MHATTRSLAVAALAIGLVASACSNSPAPETKSSGTSGTAATSASPVHAAGDAGQLQSLVPTPAGTTQSFGPDAIPDNGIHMYFQVHGSPADVVTAYKAALEGKGWTVTTIVTSTGGPGGGGGATYTGTHGDNYGVFDGGGYRDTTYLTVCTWPNKPAQPNCSRARVK
ncbi:hypothetical protein [Mycobacterium sp. OTB74]|uniref:hypothetical protein n=1 Tax=Mycobacterium sp. OTB74 TaxID=1853452 RepID=UPI002475A178|nr:hypothetical protein [Mycobacterium sp. OTB74]MDH6247131.1 hypothetical protein [Mycobacterium sp. OTB74]